MTAGVCVGQVSAMKTRCRSKRSSCSMTVTGLLLKTHSKEYFMVATKFHKKFPKEMAAIKRIAQVINSDLRTKYKQKQQKMEQERKGKKVIEESLFHGTHLRNIDNICRKGFHIPSHGHCLGLSICFTRSSFCAHLYTDCVTDANCYPKVMPVATDSGMSSNQSSRVQSRSRHNHYMLLCQVLVGHSAPADQNNLSSPVRQLDSTRHYDSCYGSDRWHKDQVAVFCEDQVYPEYIIEYQTKSE